MKTQSISNFINGKSIRGSGREIKVFSPIDGNVLGAFRNSITKDVDQAVKSAKIAQKSWGALPAKSRVQIHYQYLNLLKRDRKKLATICHLENGKTMVEALAGVDKAIELTEYACSLPHLLSGDVQTVSPGIECKTARVPIGVVASIAPFNFPVMVPHWTVPNALATGNAIVLKPSELTPLSAIKSAELWKEAGLPDGLFNVVIGTRESVERICDHPEIKAVTFVGSTPIAELVYKRSAQTLKRVMTYGGAKNYMIVTESAHPRSADDIVTAFCGMSGQRCMAASVVIQVGKGEGVKKIIEDIITKTSQMVAGQDLPPLITPAAVDKVSSYLAAAKKAGAKLRVDGRNAIGISSPKRGNYIGPSVIDWRGIEKKMPYEEIFGPTIEILYADSLEDALALQNASPYGNGTSVFTQNGRVAQDAVAGLEAGMIGVNIGIPVPREPFSFGGIKKSRFGYGGITAWPNVDFFTDVIKVTTKWNPEDKRDWIS